MGLLNATKQVGLKLSKTQGVEDMPYSKDVKDALKKWYDGENADKTAASICNAILTNGCPIIMLSRRQAEDLIKSDSNISKKFVLSGASSSVWGKAQSMIEMNDIVEKIRPQKGKAAAIYRLIDADMRREMAISLYEEIEARLLDVAVCEWERLANVKTGVIEQKQDVNLQVPYNVPYKFPCIDMICTVVEEETASSGKQSQEKATHPEANSNHPSLPEEDAPTVADPETTSPRTAEDVLREAFGNDPTIITSASSKLNLWTEIASEMLSTDISASTLTRHVPKLVQTVFCLRGNKSEWYADVCSTLTTAIATADKQAKAIKAAKQHRKQAKASTTTSDNIEETVTLEDLI